MFLRSSFPPDPTIWTMSPNPEAEEVLAQCEVLASAIFPSSGVASQSSSLKLSCETGILAPLFMLAMKCSDASLRQRAIKQIQMLDGRREGLHDAKLIDSIILALEARANESNDDTYSASGRRDLEESMERVHQTDSSRMETEAERERTTAQSQSLENIVGTVLWDDKGGLQDWAKSLGIG